MLKIDKSWKNTILYGALAINAILLVNMLFKPMYRIDEQTGLDDVDYFHGYLGVAATAVVIAVISYFVVDYEEPQFKWGARLFVTAVPIALVLMLLFYQA